MLQCGCCTLLLLAVYLLYKCISCIVKHQQCQMYLLPGDRKKMQSWPVQFCQSMEPSYPTKEFVKQYKYWRKLYHLIIHNYYMMELKPSKNPYDFIKIPSLGCKYTPWKHLCSFKYFPSSLWFCHYIFHTLHCFLCLSKSRYKLWICKYRYL